MRKCMKFRTQVSGVVRRLDALDGIVEQSVGNIAHTYRHGLTTTLGQVCRSLSPLPGSFGWAADRCLNRGLATKGGVKDQDEETESDDSISGFFDDFSSDEDSSDEDLSSKKQSMRAPRPSNDNGVLQANDHGGEDTHDEVGITGEANDLMSEYSSDEGTNEDPNDQSEPLWLRIEQAAFKHPYSLEAVMNTWVTEGNPTSRAVMITTITILRRRRKNKRALEVSDWVMKEKPFEFTDMDYAIRVELIERVYGVKEAVDYFVTIPKPFQTGTAYARLLQAYVLHGMERSAIRLVQKVEKLGLGQQTFMQNQLLSLYKRKEDMEGVAKVLQRMEEKNVEPDIYTYNTLLDIKGRKGDVTGMAKVWKQIANDKNVVPDSVSYSTLAKGFLSAGLLDKAEKATKQLEISPPKRRRMFYHQLLRLYAELGKADELERIWDIMKIGLKVLMADYSVMIQSIGKTGKIDRAEEIYKEMIEGLGSKRLQQYSALLSVYTSQGMIQKAEELVKEISKMSLPSLPFYHKLIKMYAKAGKEEAAMEALLTAQKTGSEVFRKRPWYTSFQEVLDMFAERGNVQNAEKVIQLIKDSKYTCSYRSYCALLKAYAKAEVIPYGFSDRMRADGVRLNPHIRDELKKLGGT